MPSLRTGRRVGAGGFLRLGARDAAGIECRFTLVV